MYSRTKYGPMPSNNVEDSSRQTRQTSPVQQGRRSPSEYVSGQQQYYWRGRLVPPAGSTEPKLYEPEHDEAFVEEPGIKVVESVGDDDEVVGDEVEGVETDEEDPLHELDMWDDTIVEEGEDDEDDDTGGVTKAENAAMKREPQDKDVTPSTNGFTADKKMDSEPSEGSSSNDSGMNSNLSSSSNSTSNSTESVEKQTATQQGQKQIISSIELQPCGTNSIPTNGATKPIFTSTQTTQNSSQTVAQVQMPSALILGTGVRLVPPAGVFWASAPPNARSAQLKVQTIPSAQQNTGQPPVAGRGKQGRMILPLARINPPRQHKFIIRKVNESEFIAKRNNAGIVDQRLGELRNDPLNSQGRNTRSNTSPVWYRRQADTTAGIKVQVENANEGNRNPLENTNGTISPDDASRSDQMEPLQNFRQRSGTWSMANSRRIKMKQEAAEEEATTRQRRKSGDDVLNATIKERKKDTSPGFLDSFRPRSKSDAAKNKKPNLMTTVKNAVQHSLVSPSAINRSGRKSGDATPEQQQNEVYHTWHAGSGTKTTMAKVWDLFRSHRSESTEERIRRKSGGRQGQLHRRHSMEPERRRNLSGGSQSGTYLRGEDPNQAAILFRDSRGLPVAAQFLDIVSRSELEQDETQILVKFFKHHRTYDLIPMSAKLVIFDTRLQVKKAFYALVHNGVRAAPLWDSRRQQFVGMLTITDFIRILQNFYHTNRKIEELEEHTLELWRSLLHDDARALVSIGPDESLFVAIKMLINHKIHRLPVIDMKTGNVLYIITHKRILKFLYLYMNELPKPSILQKTLSEVSIGTYENIQTATEDTRLIEALDTFVKHRVSALPIIDNDGRLIDIYAKFDAINLAAKGTYNNLNVTLKEANEYRNEWFEGVLKCTYNETLEVIMDRIVKAEVHRLVVVDKADTVIGVLSLSDLLKELVLRPEKNSETLHSVSVEDVMTATKGKLSPQPSSDDSEEIQTVVTQTDATESMIDMSAEESLLQTTESSVSSREFTGA